MNIAIIARSQAAAADLIKLYGIKRTTDHVMVFTEAEQLKGVRLGGWLVVTIYGTELVANNPEDSVRKQIAMENYLK